MTSMNRVAPAVLAAGFVAGLLACSAGGAPAEGSGNAAATPRHPVIGMLKTHDRAITLLASKDGLRVSVEDARGAAIARDVAVEELRGIDPISYQVCRSSLASRGEYLDATLTLPR
jgi:hypothetical protein